VKQIPPSIQEDHRYLLFKIRNGSKDIDEVVDAIWRSATKYMGTKASSEAQIWIMANQFNNEKQEGVIKVEKSKQKDLRAALTLNPGFKDDTFLSIEKVSGTLEGLK
jgi:RNase P/RNase MRP subunit POP5